MTANSRPGLFFQIILTIIHFCIKDEKNGLFIKSNGIRTLREYLSLPAKHVLES